MVIAMRVIFALISFAFAAVNAVLEYDITSATSCQKQNNYEQNQENEICYKRVISLLEAFINGNITFNEQQKQFIIYSDYANKKILYTDSIPVAYQVLHKIFNTITPIIDAKCMLKVQEQLLRATKEEKIALLNNLTEEQKYGLQMLRFYDFMHNVGIKYMQSQLINNIIQNRQLLKKGFIENKPNLIAVACKKELQPLPKLSLTQEIENLIISIKSHPEDCNVDLGHYLLVNNSRVDTTDLDLDYINPVYVSINTGKYGTNSKFTNQVLAAINTAIFATLTKVSTEKFLDNARCFRANTSCIKLAKTIGWAGISVCCAASALVNAKEALNIGNFSNQSVSNSS